MKGLEQRFKKFGLTLSKEKTKLLRFSKAENEKFDFLGFTYSWVVSKNGKDIIRYTTSKSKFKISVQKIKLWIKENRNKRLHNIIKSLNIKLKGYYNYYGVIGNYKMLEKMDSIVKRLLFKWMNRRSQRKSFNWTRFNKLMRDNYKIQKPFIEKDNGQMQFQI